MGPAAQTQDWQRTPKICMHFISKCGSKWCLTLLAYLFTCGLGLLVYIADKCRPVVNQFNAFNGTCLYHFSDGIWGNMGQAMVQYCKINTLVQGCHSIYPFNFVEPILAHWNNTNDLV